MINNIFSKEFNVLIVDDWEIHQKTTKTFLSHFPTIKKVYTASNANEMIQMVIDNPDINTLIVDLNLGADSLNGIQAYTLLQEAGFDIPAILITANDIDAYESYTVGIVDVVAKRFLYDFKRLNQAINRLSKYHLVKEFCDNDCTYVTVYDGQIHQILPSKVLYIEPVSSKTAVYTTLKSEPFISDFTLKSYEDYLDNSKFEKLGRFLLVNTAHIESYDEDKEWIILSNGVSLPVSASNKKYVKKILNGKNGTKVNPVKLLIKRLYQIS